MLRQIEQQKCWLSIDSFTLANSQYDFLSLKDVNKWFHNKSAECMFPPLNISCWFARSHPSKGQNRPRNCSESESVNLS